MTLELIPQAVAQDAGPFTFPGARIEGVGDITQFIVKAAPTQTNNLVEIQDNAGNALIAITPTGNVIFGQASTISTTAGDLTISPADQVYFTTAVGIGTPAPDAILDISSDTEFKYISMRRLQGVNEAGIAMRYFGGAAGTTLRANWGMTHTGSGADTIFTGELADVLAIQGVNGIQWGTSLGIHMTLLNTGRLGLGPASPLAVLHVDQQSASDAIPVLYLDQADIDIEFIKLVGSSEDGQADRSLVDVVDLTTAGALVGWFQIYIEDVQSTNPITDGVYYVPFYATPTQ